MDQAGHGLGGVSPDTPLEGVAAKGACATAFSDGGYTTNQPLADLRGGTAWVAFTCEGKPLAPEHGGPARLPAPHLYLWKSGRRVRGTEITLRDEPDFREQPGYHNPGYPQREQRSQGD